MALFVEIQVAASVRSNAELTKKLCEVCPVSIFNQKDSGELEIVDQNVDECTLCELCLDIGQPGDVKVLKLYDEGKPLERSA